MSDEQPWKQKYPKLLTDDGIIVLRHPAIMVLVFVSMIALQLSRESYTGLFVSTRIEASEEQASFLQSIVYQYNAYIKVEKWR